MNLTKSQQKLLADAQANGYAVTVESKKVTIKKARKGIAIFEDGTAYRFDVSDAITIRTQKVMRQVLGLPAS